jgi:hypothetical protein
VSARIKELLSLGITCRLGELVREAFAPEAPTRDRLPAIMTLIDRGGLTAPKHAPDVAVQVNVGEVLSEREVSAVIGDIEALRAARLSAAGSC